MLFTLTLLGATAGGTGAIPIARSYDGLPWELSGQTYSYPIDHGDGTDSNASTITLPWPNLGAGGQAAQVLTSASRSFVIQRYSSHTHSDAAAYHSDTDRDAVRLLNQATFGTTRDSLRNLTTVGQSAAEWMLAQMALPASLHRAHYRRRVNPRIRQGAWAPFLTQPACAPGSRWNTFAFNEEDEGKVLTVEGLEGPGATYRLTIDDEVRTEVNFDGADANYTMMFSGRCVGLYENIPTLEECTTAAVVLRDAFNLTWDEQNYGSYSENPRARDDGRGAAPLTRATAGPRGCYIEGRPPRYDGSMYGGRYAGYSNWRSLLFNVNDTNTGSCTTEDMCICRRKNLVRASTDAPSAPPPSAPPAPPPLAPGETMNVTDPRDCDPSQCCVVLFKNAQGVNCAPVPIWNFNNWIHPGPSSVIASRLCSSVRYSWLGRSTSHGTCDSSFNCDPEADDWRSLTGGAVRIGTYVDSSPECGSNSYTICDVIEGIGGYMRLTHVGGSCSTSSNKDNFILRNPTILIGQPSAILTQTVAAADVSITPVLSAASVDSYILTRLAFSCTLSAQRSSYLRVTEASGASTWYRHDKRLVLQSNTVESPCQGIGLGSSSPLYEHADACVSPHRNRINAHGCTRRASATAPRFATKLFMLNDTSLRAYYERAGLLAYRVAGLRLETAAYIDNPCSVGISRWWRVAAVPCTDSAEAGPDTALDSSTQAAITAAMNASRDMNEFVKDIDIRATIATQEQGSCTSTYNGVSTMGAQVTVGGQCWRHVPKEEGNVYSFSFWSLEHLGNRNFGASKNPIMRWAKAGLTRIEFPRSHSMSTRWGAKRTKMGDRFIGLIGRYGDVVDFAALKPFAQPREMAMWLGATELPREMTMVCGSPGEVASDPTLGNRYRTRLSAEGDKVGSMGLNYPVGVNDEKQTVWTTIVLSAPDQLRQRVAFALSQIVVIGEEGLGKQDEHEGWLAFYDIFVRHAFGSYRDILWEVSNSPMMAHYLTFHGNRALHIAGTNPDENCTTLHVPHQCCILLHAPSCHLLTKLIDSRSLAQTLVKSCSSLASGCGCCDRTAATTLTPRGITSPPMTTRISWSSRACGRVTSVVHSAQTPRAEIRSATLLAAAKTTSTRPTWPRMITTLSPRKTCTIGTLATATRSASICRQRPSCGRARRIGTLASLRRASRMTASRTTPMSVRTATLVARGARSAATIPSATTGGT